MKEKIAAWYTTNNNHPCDDERFFDIVIESADNKVDFSVFEEALKYCDENISNDEIDNIYKKYELLRSFLRYYRSLSRI